MLDARAAARPSKARRRQDARAGFQRRLRALDLLEQLTRQQPASPHLLRAVLPLVAAVRDLQAAGASADAAAARSSALPPEARDLRQVRDGLASALPIGKKRGGRGAESSSFIHT